MASIVSTERPTAFRRQTIHDLRNLFGVVASAKHILESDPARAQRIALLEAIEDAATRGGALTTDLLAGAAVGCGYKRAEVSRCIAELKLMAVALAGPDIELRADIDRATGLVGMVPSDFDAAILELIANAAAADASTITLRCRQVGRRIWVMVSDDGRGMSRRVLERARHGGGFAGAHGAGLGRVRHFAGATHGRFLIRSRHGAGTSAILILPAVLKITGSSDSANRQRTFSNPEEMNDEERQSTAA